MVVDIMDDDAKENAVMGMVRCVQAIRKCWGMIWCSDGSLNVSATGREACLDNYASEVDRQVR